MLKKFRKSQDKAINLHLEKARKGKLIAIYRLFNRYYVKSFFGPFFAFVFPVLIYAILGTVMDYKLMFAGVVGITTLTSLTSMPVSILELKKSVLMKRIGASPVKTSTFTFVIVSYFAFQNILAVLWLMLWALILYQDLDMFNFLTTTRGFFSFLYGTFLNILISIALGFLVASISKGEQQAQAISMLIMFVSQFLSGMFITIDAVSSNNVMNWISRFVPYRYSIMYLVSSQYKDVNPFLFKDVQGVVPLSSLEAFKMGNQAQLPGQQMTLTKNVTFYEDWETIMAYVYPWAIISISTLFAIKKFSWSSAR